MTSMLVIDTTSRALAVFTANVTQAPAGLVVRPGLELPGLDFFVGDADWRSPKKSKLPVLLIGEGYSAQSSAGFVSLKGAIPWEKTPIVGWLGDRGLRAIKPLEARLLEPVRMLKDKTFSNSNSGTAQAVLDGLPLLAAADPSAILIAEGQSDRVNVHRLLPATPGRSIGSVSRDSLDTEHRSELFTHLACVESAARAAAWAAHDRAREEGWGSTPEWAFEYARDKAAEAAQACAAAIGLTDFGQEDILTEVINGLRGSQMTVHGMPAWEAELLGLDPVIAPTPTVES